MTYFEILVGEILARAKISILLAESQDFSLGNRRPNFFREESFKLDISENLGERIKTRDARPSAVPTMESPAPAALRLAGSSAPTFVFDL